MQRCIALRRFYHGVPFLDFYEKSTGTLIDEVKIKKLRKKHPKLEHLTTERISCVQQILEKFGITSVEACAHPHVYTMNPITLDNYGEVLRECALTTIQPNFLIKYHTLVRTYSIAQLKKLNHIPMDTNVEEKLIQCFHTWPPSHKLKRKISEQTTSLLQVRLKIMSMYLNWRLEVSNADFDRYCECYLVIKHRPLSDIQEAVDLAQNDIKINLAIIRSHGCLISADPLNTKLILENVPELAGLDIRQVIRIEPAIVKNNYNAILKIRDILEEYRISNEAQKRCLRVYCMRPQSVRQRLVELFALKEFQVLATNPRALHMVVHSKKMLLRIQRMRAANKHCYSLNVFVASNKVFNDRMNTFGDRTRGRDLASVICSSLKVDVEKYADPSFNITRRARRTASGESLSRVAAPTVTVTPPSKYITAQLSKHAYWRNVPPGLVHANIHMLKEHFDDEVIYENCHLLLYPISQIQQSLEIILELKKSPSSKKIESLHLDPSFLNLDYTKLSDFHILSLILYAMEKKFHFTGDGIWSKSDVQLKSQAVAEN